MFTVDYYDTAGGRRKKEIIGKLEISIKKDRKLGVFLSLLWSEGKLTLSG